MDIIEFRHTVGLVNHLPNDCYQHLKNTYEIAGRKFKKEEGKIIFRISSFAGMEANELDFKKALKRVWKDCSTEQSDIDSFIVFLNKVLKE